VDGDQTRPDQAKGEERWSEHGEETGEGGAACSFLQADGGVCVGPAKLAPDQPRPGPTVAINLNEFSVVQHWS